MFDDNAARETLRVKLCVGGLCNEEDADALRRVRAYEARIAELSDGPYQYDLEQAGCLAACDLGDRVRLVWEDGTFVSFARHKSGGIVELPEDETDILVDPDSYAAYKRESLR